MVSRADRKFHPKKTAATVPRLVSTPSPWRTEKLMWTENPSRSSPWTKSWKVRRHFWGDSPMIYIGFIGFQPQPWIYNMIYMDLLIFIGFQPWIYNIYRLSKNHGISRQKKVSHGWTTKSWKTCRCTSLDGWSCLGLGRETDVLVARGKTGRPEGLDSCENRLRTNKYTNMTKNWKYVIYIHIYLYVTNENDLTSGIEKIWQDCFWLTFQNAQRMLRYIKHERYA